MKPLAELALARCFLVTVPVAAGSSAGPVSEWSPERARTGR